MSLGEKLRDARKRAGYTQRQLADIIGAKHNSVSNWEKGLNNPNPEMIGELCAVLNITPNDLLIGAELEGVLRTKDGLSPDEAAFIRRYRGLDRTARGAVEALCDYYSGLSFMKHSGLRAAAPAEDIAVAVVGDTDSAVIQGRISRQSVAAGTGTYLDEDSFDQLTVQNNDVTRRGSFYVPVSGNSMEPRYRDGDILIIEDAPVKRGEIGVFTLDGYGYVKKLGESELISLNPDYAPIPMNEGIICNGRVIGVLEPAWIM